MRKADQLIVDLLGAALVEKNFSLGVLVFFFSAVTPPPLSNCDLAVARDVPQNLPHTCSDRSALCILQ